MAVFVIPRAQTLRFVDITNYPELSLRRDGQTFDNRLLLDEKWRDSAEGVNEYTQKFVAGDPILIQITTDYDPDYISIKLIKAENDIIDPNGIFTSAVQYYYADGLGNVVYNYSLNQNIVTFDGLYYVQITVEDPLRPYLQFNSETFEFGEYLHLPYISWQSSDTDGIYWDDAETTIFGFRCELFQKYAVSSESSVYAGFNFQPETLFSVPKRIIELTSDPIPRYIAEKLELAIHHFSLFVNGVPYTSNGESAKITQLERTNMYEFNVPLIQVDFEDYSILSEVTGIVIINQVFEDYDNYQFTDYDDALLDGQI